MRSCEDCKLKKLDFVANRLDENNVEEVKYCFWINSPRCEIINKEENVNDFIENLKNLTEKFLVHQFKVDKQNKFIRAKKESLGFCSSSS